MLAASHERSHPAGLMDFILNGRKTQLPDGNPHTTLLDWLRAAGFTGSKEGCAEGECGACTVLLVRPQIADDTTLSKYVPMNSCLLLLPMVAGQEVYTVEALATTEGMCEVQRAMAEGGGSQCGYCTPGFVVSLFAEQYRPGRIGPCDPHSMGGNLCRCTGYRPIRDAALSIGPAPDDAFRARLTSCAPSTTPFATNGFHCPRTISECLQLMAANPGARYVAGATDVAVESNLRDLRWPLLVSTEALAELQVFTETASEIEIGAGLPLSEIELRWQDAPPAFKEWFPLFASPLIRNRATLGGNLATGSPIGDAAPLLLAFDAALNITGQAGARQVQLSDFFLGYRKTHLAPGELLVSITIPKPLPHQARFYKVAKRQLDDISTIAACFALDCNEGGKIERARITYGGVAATPIRVTVAEELLVGMPWNQQTVEQAQALIATELKPLDDHRGSAAYRLAMAKSLLAKFWFEQSETPE